MRAQRLPAGLGFALVWAVLYRLCVAAVVGFWLLMAGLLAHTVWFRGDARPQPVPLEYIGHLIFRHELSSDLVLYRGHHRADGSFHLQPKRLAAGEGRPAPGNLLGASGNFLLGLPGLAGQRVVFHGTLEIDAQAQVQRVDLSVSIHEPKSNTPGATLHLDGVPAGNHWHYQLTQAGATLREGSGTPEELLAALDTRAYGLDRGMLSPAATRSGAVTVSAQRGKLHLSEDDLDTFVVTVRHGEGLETTVHLNQVGQVLAVKTFLGFDLYDETLTP